MAIICLLIAGVVSSLGAVVLFAVAPITSTASRYWAALILGVVAGAVVGLVMGRVNPPQYDWFGFYPLSQLVTGVVGGGVGGLATAAVEQWRRAVGPAVAKATGRRAAIATALLGLLASVLAGFFYLFPPTIPTRHMAVIDDAFFEPQTVREGMTMEEVRETIGSPMLVAQDEDYSSWFYGIRRGVTLSTDGRIPAPLLKITIDSSDHVQSWGFVHKRTRMPLEVDESWLQATRWLNAACGAGDGPRIVLEERLIPGVTTSDEVLATFGNWSMQPWTTEHRREIFAQTQADGSLVLTYPVDHPSPMYLPAMYVELSFDRAGKLQSWSFVGGC